MQTRMVEIAKTAIYNYIRLCVQGWGAVPTAEDVKQTIGLTDEEVVFFDISSLVKDNSLWD